jgi:Tol biopolymer transport system component
LFRSDEGALLAQGFDNRHLELVGDAVLVAEQVSSGSTRGAFSASANGTLVFWTGNFSRDVQFTWLDLQGKPVHGEGEPGEYADVTLSPDGTQAVASKRDRRRPLWADHLWLLDFARGTNNQFTLGPARHRSPVWSPDGGRIIFASDRDGQSNLYQKPANSAKDEDALLKDDSEIKTPTSWSRDGYLLYTVQSAKAKAEIWALQVDGDHKPVPFVHEGSMGRFSRDGHWVAYVSDESGRDEVYVREFSMTSAGIKRVVSKEGGSNPRWRRDGKALFYTAPDGMVMIVDLMAGGVLQPGQPKALFKLPSDLLANWDVAADGDQFLVAVPVQHEDRLAPFNIVLNWPAMLKK